MKKVGTRGDDRIGGTAKDDFLRGKAGDDTLIGRKGSDVLFGGRGDDTLIGGEGIDALKGGKGADTFVLQSAGQIDTIFDFNPATDRIVIDVPLTEIVPASDVFGTDLLYSGSVISYRGHAIAAVDTGLGITADDFLIATVLA